METATTLAGGALVGGAITAVLFTLQFASLMLATAVQSQHRLRKAGVLLLVSFHPAVIAVLAVGHLLLSDVHSVYGDIQARLILWGFALTAVVVASILGKHLARAASARSAAIWPLGAVLFSLANTALVLALFPMTRFT